MIDGIGMLLNSISASTNAYVNLLSQQNAVAIHRQPVDMEVVRRAAAQTAVEQGDAVLDRVGFWMGIVSFPVVRWIAERVLLRLVDSLDAISDEIERWAPAS